MSVRSMKEKRYSMRLLRAVQSATEPKVKKRVKNLIVSKEIQTL